MNNFLPAEASTYLGMEITLGGQANSSTSSWLKALPFNLGGSWHRGSSARGTRSESKSRFKGLNLQSHVHGLAANSMPCKPRRLSMVLGRISRKLLPLSLSFSSWARLEKALAATRRMPQWARSKVTNCGIISKAFDSIFCRGLRDSRRSRKYGISAMQWNKIKWIRAVYASTSCGCTH